MIRLALPLAALVALSAPALAQTMAPADYVAQAGAGDLYERTSSQLVLETTRNDKVRDFAQTMIQHHSKSTADVKAAAARDGVKAPPPALMPAQQQMIAELRAARGEARDAAYLTQQRTAHDQALALHRGYAENGASPALKQAAGTIAPVVQQHIEMLKTM